VRKCHTPISARGSGKGDNSSVSRCDGRDRALRWHGGDVEAESNRQAADQQ